MVCIYFAVCALLRMQPKWTKIKKNIHKECAPVNILDNLKEVIEKSRLRETLNLLTCAESSTHTKMEKKERKGKTKSCVRCHMSRVTCYMSCATCHMFFVTCHLSLTPTTTATDFPPVNSPIMHSRLVCKPHKYFKTEKLLKHQKN